MKHLPKIIVCLFLPILIFGCAFLKERLNDKRARLSYEKGLEYYYNKDYERAVKSFKKSINILKDVAVTHFYLANTYEELGEIDLAVEEYRQTILYSPDREESYTAIADIYIKQEKIDEAIDLYLKSLSLLREDEKNKKVSLYLKIGSLYFNRKEFSRAVPYFKKASNTNPYRILPYYRLALSYEKLKDYDNALELYEKAESLFYTVSFAEQQKAGYFEKIYNKLGKEYISKGLLNLAEIYLKKSLALNSGYKEAKENLLRVRRLKKESLKSLNQISKQLKSGEYENALKKLKELLKTNSESYKAYLYLGNIYFRKKDNKRAIKNYNKAVTVYYAYNKKENPLFAELHTNLGFLYTQEKRYDDALTEYINAYPKTTKKADILIHIKDIYDKKWEDAGSISE